VAGGHKFRQVDAGDFHTCAVGYPDNRAWCWGYNGSNAIGDGSTALYRPTPVTVSGTRQFRQVDVGQFHSCGVTTADRAFCWGYNQYGQLGDSSAIPSYRSTPTAVAGGHPFRQISAGQDVTCAVSTFNQAWCWGNGQRPDRRRLHHPAPLAESGRRWAQVHSGDGGARSYLC
jgi:alpha-tubulin suppressor-like RCC1 family protein